MVDSWYSWFPGMGDDSKEKPELISPISYQTEITFYSRRTLIAVGKLNTTVTWYMGRILCTGLLPENNIMVDAITDIVTRNESQVIPAERIQEYSTDFDVMIVMERNVLCTSKANN